MVAARGKGEVAGEDTPRDARTLRTEEVLLDVVVIMHLCARWLSNPQGEPSGVWTGHRKPRVHVSVRGVQGEKETYPSSQEVIFELLWFSIVRRRHLCVPFGSEK